MSAPKIFVVGEVEFAEIYDREKREWLLGIVPEDGSASRIVLGAIGEFAAGQRVRVRGVDSPAAITAQSVDVLRQAKGGGK